MKNGYVVFEMPVILHSGLDRFEEDIPKSEFSLLSENGYLFVGNETPEGLCERKLYFHKKYNSSEYSRWTAYIIDYKGYRLAITNPDGPSQEISYSLPEELFEID